MASSGLYFILQDYSACCFTWCVQGPNAQCSISTALMANHKNDIKQIILWNTSHRIQQDSSLGPFYLESKALPSQLPCFGWLELLNGKTIADKGVCYKNFSNLFIGKFWKQHEGAGGGRGLKVFSGRKNCLEYVACVESKYQQIRVPPRVSSKRWVFKAWYLRRDKFKQKYIKYFLNGYRHSKYLPNFGAECTYK